MIKTLYKNIRSIFLKLNGREQLLVSITAIAVVFTVFYLGVDFVFSTIKEDQRILTVRTNQLNNVVSVAARFKQLDHRMDKLKESFAKSEMSFEQVTTQLDKIVRESIGSDNYELKKGRTPTALGFDFEKQQFSLNINSISLEQTVKLLYNLENSKSPLLLGKVDFRKFSGDKFVVNVEIFSIRKSTEQAA